MGDEGNDCYSSGAAPDRFLRRKPCRLPPTSAAAGVGRPERHCYRLQYWRSPGRGPTDANWRHARPDGALLADAGDHKHGRSRAGTSGADSPAPGRTAAGYTPAHCREKHNSQAFCWPCSALPEYPRVYLPGSSRQQRRNRIPLRQQSAAKDLILQPTP